MDKIKFQYTVGDKKFIVSLAEHLFITKNPKEELKIVKLRGGLVQFNMAYFQYCEIIEDSIIEEAKARLIEKGIEMSGQAIQKQARDIYHEIAAQFGTDVKYLT